MSATEQTTLKSTSEEIQVIYQNKEIIPWDEESFIKIDYIINEENAQEIEITDPDYLVDISRIYGSVNIGNPESALSFIVKVDSQFEGWKIKCTNVDRINGIIFPHQIEINLDDMTMLVKFNVYS